MTGVLGDRIVAYRDVAVCDRDHEVTLYTDGTHAYAHGAVTDCPSVTREGHYVQVVCGQPLRGTPGIEPDACDDTVIFDLTDEAWTADREAIETLTAHGERIAK